MIHYINKMKDKDHKIPSIGAGRAFEKNSASIYNKTPQKEGIEV